VPASTEKNERGDDQSKCKDQHNDPKRSSTRGIWARRLIDLETLRHGATLAQANEWPSGRAANSRPSVDAMSSIQPAHFL
jgi:hypothetical protein